MAPTIDPDALARMCFRKVPDDIVDTDVVLAALWHLHRRRAEAGLDPTMPSRTTILGRDAGLRSHDFREALRALIDQGLVHRDARGLVGLTTAGYLKSRDIIDVDRVIAFQQARLAA